ncbi:calcium channel flower isoform X2 [Lepeophtheirus salmonis]|uniref:Calcium channel flower n=2 Tax=Lepeophtheirus salmonis TaxID=72036 RepID=A0A0K2TXE7_LEPSM|nr:calcium channel flower-like isoform X1 [Lepeophtheirus salmonis]
MQNFFSKMDPTGGSGAGAANDGVPWLLKYGSKAIGIAAGIAAMFFGLWVCITLSPLCIVAGIWQICSGFLVILIEAPFCCMFLDFVQKFSSLVENRPVWQKAALYLVVSVVPLLMCWSTTAIVGSIVLFALASLNGLLFLGKKASLEEMQSKVSESTVAGPSSDHPPTYNEAINSGLVDNIQGQDVEAARSKK